MRRLSAVFGLQVYAVVLAILQSLGHVRTDEAKYLLNIPYPHPPLARWVMSLTDSWSFQEMFWRIVLATLVIQAVWLVWSMGKELRKQDRFLLCGLYLVCAAVVFQAGSIMMAPITAMQGLVFVWLYIRKDKAVSAGWLSLFWLATLFTAFQGGLYLPIIIALFRRTRLPLWQQVLLVGLPILLLGLYTLSNPLALASLVNAGTDNTHLAMSDILFTFLATWAIAGSIAFTISGTIGMFVGRMWPIVATFLLISVYNFLSVHLYYAILFVPLLIAGGIGLARHYPKSLQVQLVGAVVGTIFLWSWFHPELQPTKTREIARMIQERGQEGLILIAGSFGHDWQYESSAQVRRFIPALRSLAQAVLCKSPCSEMEGQASWSFVRVGEWQVFMPSNAPELDDQKIRPR